MKVDMFLCKPPILFYFMLLSMKQKQRKSPEQTASCSGRARSKPKPRPQQLQKKKAKGKKTMVDVELLISCVNTHSYFTKNLSNFNNILESDGYRLLPVNLTCCTRERSNRGGVERSTKRNQTCLLTPDWSDTH